jgi:hypothetical protein
VPHPSWENEAPTARAACSPSQAQPADLVDQLVGSASSKWGLGRRTDEQGLGPPMSMLGPNSSCHNGPATQGRRAQPIPRPSHAIANDGYREWRRSPLTGLLEVQPAGLSPSSWWWSLSPNQPRPQLLGTTSTTEQAIRMPIGSLLALGGGCPRPQQQLVLGALDGPPFSPDRAEAGATCGVLTGRVLREGGQHHLVGSGLDRPIRQQPGGTGGRAGSSPLRCATPTPPPGWLQECPPR